MSEREHLVELLLESEPIKERDLDDDWGDNEISDIAEHLIKNDVIVPTLKLGDKVWIIEHYYGYETKSYEVVYIKYVKDCGGQLCYYSAMPFGKPISSIDFDDRDIGKTIFLTKSEALKALKGGVTNE